MSYTAAVITVSDKGSRGERVDTSGPAVRAIAEAHGFTVAYTSIVPDEKDQIEAERGVIARFAGEEVARQLTLEIFPFDAGRPVFEVLARRRLPIAPPAPGWTCEKLVDELVSSWDALGKRE